ncbi:hypothetical protein BX600DRAFT_282455 [Xylariales sp. PMI_506]|nr:hypothetical protein BX600DRAFT_282455 [Xylariales sp. PMI_506]
MMRLGAFLGPLCALLGAASADDVFQRGNLQATTTAGCGDSCALSVTYGASGGFASASADCSSFLGAIQVTVDAASTSIVTVVTTLSPIKKRCGAPPQPTFASTTDTSSFSSTAVASSSDSTTTSSSSSTEDASSSSSTTDISSSSSTADVSSSSSPSTTPATIPTYATAACIQTSAYISACSCIGVTSAQTVTGSVTTVVTSTTTITAETN